MIPASLHRTAFATRKRPICAAIALLTSSALITTPAFAESASETLNQVENNTTIFKKVTVNAMRMTTDIDDVKRAISVIDNETIETLQAQSIAETLRYEPNVTPFGGPRKGQQSVNIRGLADEKVLQTIDGIRQDFNSGHRPSYFLDPVLLKSVEVVKGPASSLWGSGALGGVVAQSTVSARDLLKPEQNFGGLLKTGFNFNNNQTTNTAAIAGRTPTIDWLISGYFRDSDDLEQGNGQTLLDSGARDAGALIKAEWQIDDTQSLGINIRRANADGNIPNNGSAQATNSNFVVDRKQRTSTTALDYGLNLSPLLNAKAIIYRNSVEMDENRVSDGRADSTEQETYGIQLSNQSDIRGINLLYGIDGYREDFTAQRTGTNRPQPPEAITTVMGAFAQATIPLNAQWQMELGARYDDFNTDEKSLGKRSENALSPSAALTYKATKWLEMTVRHDRAFRAPTAEELFTTGTHFCGGPLCNTFVANPNLRPESAANSELLAKMRFQNIFANDELRINASVFENNVDNFIEQIVTGPTAFGPFGPTNLGISTFENVDKATLRGVELAANYRLNALQASLAYGQVRGRDDASGRSLSNIPADTITADVSYGFYQEQLRAGARLISAASQDRKPATDINTYDGYTIGDIYATWKPQTLKALSFSVNINNVSDRHYRRAFSQLFESGREIITSVRYDF